MIAQQITRLQWTANWTVERWCRGTIRRTAVRPSLDLFALGCIPVMSDGETEFLGLQIGLAAIDQKLGFSK
jgi:hypothetical protein